MIETIERGFVFTQAPFAECHASTLAKTATGWAVAWFGGTREKHPDVGIWLSLSDGDGSWSAPQRVAKIDPAAHWNPVLFAAPDGVLHLWFKTGPTIPHWKTFTQVSLDGGKTWSAARELVPGDDTGGRGPVKNKPILLSCGALLAGGSSEQGSWEAFIDRSEDGGGGRTWTRTPNFDRAALGKKHGCIQPTLWESEPGTVHALVRSSGGFLPRTDSFDGGRTWCPLYDSGLPSNNSGVDLARLPDGTLALVYNPVSGDWGARSPLRLSLSPDNGKTWPDSLDLEVEPGGEFSYPAIVSVGDDEMAAVYTWKRTRIGFWRGRVG